jgi:glycosyltransferase involved in cell wall biosynthesis
VSGLLNQTFKDWVCEVHNDNPEDRFPVQYIDQLNDDRFKMVQHTTNLGAVKTFNMAFNGCEEAYASILEDDNWWEPEFLAAMMGTLDANPDRHIAWSNMRLWREQSDGDWLDTGLTTWPAGDGLTTYTWPSPQQALGALHSTGAMIYRGLHAAHYKVPEETLLNAVELVRERSFEHPIVMVSKPLANFAITRKTNRSANPYLWIGSQVMMLSSFVATADSAARAFQTSLAYCRRQKPKPVAVFFLAQVFHLKKAGLCRYFSLTDWFFITKWLIRNAHQLPYLKKYLEQQAGVYDFLCRQTQIRYEQG